MNVNAWLVHMIVRLKTLKKNWTKKFKKINWLTVWQTNRHCSLFLYWTKKIFKHYLYNRHAYKHFNKLIYEFIVGNIYYHDDVDDEYPQHLYLECKIYTGMHRTKSNRIKYMNPNHIKITKRCKSSIWYLSICVYCRVSVSILYLCLLFKRCHEFL